MRNEKMDRKKFSLFIILELRVAQQNERRVNSGHRGRTEKASLNEFTEFMAIRYSDAHSFRGL